MNYTDNQLKVAAARHRIGKSFNMTLTPKYTNPSLL